MNPTRREILHSAGLDLRISRLEMIKYARIASNAQ